MRVRTLKTRHSASFSSIVSSDLNRLDVDDTLLCCIVSKTTPFSYMLWRAACSVPFLGVKWLENRSRVAPLRTGKTKSPMIIYCLLLCLFAAVDVDGALVN